MCDEFDINHPFFFGSDHNIQYCTEIDHSWFDFPETHNVEDFVPIVPNPSFLTSDKKLPKHKTIRGKNRIYIERKYESDLFKENTIHISSE